MTLVQIVPRKSRSGEDEREFDRGFLIRQVGYDIVSVLGSPVY